MGEYTFPDDYKNKIDVIVNPEKKTLKFIDTGLGMTADEVEEYITQCFGVARQVTVIHEHRVYLMKDFEEYGIGQITGAKVCRFFEDGVEYETADGEHHEARGYDSVVLSMGYRNYNPLEEQVKAIVPDTYVIGDAIRARRALDATKEAYDVASQI